MFCIFTNWLSSPLAFVLTLASGLVLVIGALALGRAYHGQPGSVMCRNPECGHTNPPRARYCARCGQELRGA
jgi:hypothetical protein